MIFTDLRVQHYRSYQDSSFDLGPGVNIVVGPNAAGKTNLLEALMVAAVGKSYRARDPMLIEDDQDWARVDVHTSKNIARTVKLQLDEVGRLQKTFEIDDKIYKRLPTNLKQPTVLFEPNNLNLLHNEPVHRREYVDDLIEQFTPGYNKLRSDYRRVVAQRNSLLKQGRGASSQLFAWNLRLSELASQIVAARSKLIESINQNIADIYNTIANHKNEVSLAYQSSINLDNYASSLLKKLESSLALDMARGFTGSGPHREDIVVYFGDRSAAECASRGETRTLMLALKIIELQLLEKESGTRPLLLLDDVFSELDGSRRKALTNFLKNYQTIITTTDADIVVKHFTHGTTIIPLQRTN